MTTRFSHTARFGAPLEVIHTTYADEAYWMDRLASIGGPGDTLDSFSTGPRGVEVTVTQVIPDDDIPEVARKVLPGRLAITRTMSYGPFDGAQFAFTARAEAIGGIGVIDGGGEATSDGPGATESITGSAKVAVPLLGGRLEKLVVGHLSELFVAEYAHLETWVTSY